VESRGTVKDGVVLVSTGSIAQIQDHCLRAVIFPTPPGVGCGAGAADILRMVANQHSIKTNFPDSESFLMSEWTSKDVAVKDAAFTRLLKVICGETNECSQGVRHVTLYWLFSRTQRPSPRDPCSARVSSSPRTTEALRVTHRAAPQSGEQPASAPTPTPTLRTASAHLQHRHPQLATRFQGTLQTPPPLVHLSPQAHLSPSLPRVERFEGPTEDRVM